MSVYVKHNGEYVKLPYFYNGDIPVYDQGTIKYLKSTSTPGLVAFLDRNQIKYIDMNTIGSTDTIWGRYNPLKETDVIWGHYIPLKEVDVIWGNYDSGGGNMRYDLNALTDFNMIDQYFMIEKNWHKLQGATPGNLQSYLRDANGQLMDNPEFVIDVYYKLIVARPSNWGAAVSLLNPNGRLDTLVFNNYGFTPTFLDSNQYVTAHIGAYYENPIAPFDLPADSVLKDGYTSVQFPEGSYFDFLASGDFSNYTDILLYGEFIGLAGRLKSSSMMPICEMYTQDIITYTIDETASAMGVPFTGLSAYYMPKLFTGMLAGPHDKKRNGILYLCLGVHHI